MDLKRTVGESHKQPVLDLCLLLAITFMIVMGVRISIFGLTKFLFLVMAINISYLILRILFRRRLNIMFVVSLFFMMFSLAVFIVDLI